MLDFFRDLMSGKQAPSIHEESSYTFVQGKHKCKDRCPRHGCELVKLKCKKYPDGKRSSHTMSVIEPAPPPVEAKAMKLRIFDYLCAQRKWTSLVQLRKTVGLALQRVEESDNGPIQLFDGTLIIHCAKLKRRLRMVRPPIPKLAVEVGELSMMAADEGNA